MNVTSILRDKWHGFKTKSYYYNPFHRARAHISAAGFPLGRGARELLEVRDCHSNQVCFLVGNGPSVRIEDLELLSGRVCFCANRFYLAYGRTTFRPSYLVSGDRQMISDFGAEILERAGCPVWFFNDGVIRLPGNYFRVMSFGKSPFKLEKNVIFGVNTGGSSLIMALQAGYWMGIRKFFLYGVDHSFAFTVDDAATDRFKSAKGDGNHFISGYRSGRQWCPPAKEFIEQAFKECDMVLRNEGGWVKNATRGGSLDVLERCSLEVALRES